MFASKSQDATAPLLSTGQSKPKTTFRFIWALLSVIAVCVTFYWVQPNLRPSAVFSRTARYSRGDEKQEKHRDYPANMIEINYNVRDLMAFAGEDGPLMPHTPLWNEFHEELIVQAGYDPDQIRHDPESIVNFHAHDDDAYLDELNIETVDFDVASTTEAPGAKGAKGAKSPGGKGSSTPSPTIGPAGMHCYTSFVMMDDCEYTDRRGDCSGTYNGGQTRWARCGTHTEPGFFGVRGGEYSKIFSDDRTGCMGIWSDNETPGAVFSGVRGYVLPDDDVYAVEQRPGLTTYVHDMRCEGFGLTGQWTGIGARCCLLPDPANTYFTSWDTSLVSGGSAITKDYHSLLWASSSGEFCPSNSCAAETDGYDTALGCGGGQGGGSSLDTMGREYAGQKQEGDVCKTERNDEGFINANVICGSVQGGDLSCTQVSSDSAQFQSTDVYYSTSQCPTDYAMTDCNGYIVDQIDMCPMSNSTPDVFYGEMTSGDQCVGVGNSANVRSQVNCCKVDY